MFEWMNKIQAILRQFMHPTPPKEGIDALLEHLWHAPMRIFKPSERNHTLGGIYILLKSSVIRKADFFQVTPTKIEWGRDDTILGKFLIDRDKPGVSDRAMLHKIMQRDKLVRRHFRLVSQTETEETYQ